MFIKACNKIEFLKSDLFFRHIILFMINIGRFGNFLLTTMLFLDTKATF